MLIDVHAHYVPPSVIEEVQPQAARFGLSVVRQPLSCTCALHFNYGLKVRPFFPKLIEPVCDRLAAMEEQGVTHQVLSCWADIFAYVYGVAGPHDTDAQGRGRRASMRQPERTERVL